MERCLTSVELADRLAVSVDTIVRLRRAGRIPFLTVSSQHRYEWSAVREALAAEDLAGQAATVHPLRRSA